MYLRFFMVPSIYADAGIFANPVHSRLLLWCHYLVRPQPFPYSFNRQTLILQPGQVFLGQGSVEKHTGITAREYRTAIKQLQKMGILFCETTNHGTLATLVYSHGYRAEGSEGGKQATSKRHASDQQSPNNIEDKNMNREKNMEILPPLPSSAEEVAAYCKENGYDIVPEDFYNHYQKNGWIANGTPIYDWKSLLKTWVSNLKTNNKNCNKNMNKKSMSANARIARLQNIIEK